jgi:NAD(P)-dependent dehydrogenase (short-subunit alcohol dehydrogenase family)
MRTWLITGVNSGFGRELTTKVLNPGPSRSWTD